MGVRDEAVAAIADRLVAENITFDPDLVASEIALDGLLGFLRENRLSLVEIRSNYRPYLENIKVADLIELLEGKEES